MSSHDRDDMSQHASFLGSVEQGQQQQPKASDETYNLTDDLVFLICDVDSHTSYSTIKSQWYHRDQHQDDRFRLVISSWIVPVLFLIMIYAFLDVLFRLNGLMMMIMVLFALCCVYLIAYSYYLVYYTGKRMMLKSMHIK